MDRFQEDKEKLKASIQHELDDVSLIEEERNELYDENLLQKRVIE